MKTETEKSLIKEMWRVRKEHRNRKNKKPGDPIFGEMFYHYSFQLWCFRNMYDRNEVLWNNRLTSSN